MLSVFIKKTFMLTIIVKVIAFIIGLTCACCSKCDNNSSRVVDNEISMYYADTLDISTVLPQNVDSLWCNNKNVILRGKQLYLKNPLSLAVNDFMIPIFFMTDKEVKKFYIKIYCWKDNVYQLQETTEENYLVAKLKKSYYNRFRDKISFYKKFNTPILLTKNGQTY